MCISLPSDNDHTRPLNGNAAALTKEDEIGLCVFDVWWMEAI